MGEFHYSRDPDSDWEDEILKITTSKSTQRIGPA
jgi:hypothetical protein